MNGELALSRWGGNLESGSVQSLLAVPFARLFAFLVVVFSLGMFESFLLKADGSSSSAGTFALQIPWACIYAGTVTWTILHIRSVSRLALNSKLLLLPPCLALLSSQWAQDPGPVERRSIALLCTYLIGAFIALTCDLRGQVKLLCVGMLIAIVVCYLAEILMPGWVPVIEEHAGSWNGVFPHKNILARMMVLAVLAFLCFRPRHAFGRWIRGGGISASLGLIVLSRSATGILMMSALLCCYFIFRCTRLRGRQFILLLAGSIALLVMGSLFLVNYSDALLRVVGRDSSWSGRTVLWKVSLLSIAKRPLLGYGFHAFWRENNESLTARSLLTNHWDAPHAHNGFIETLLQLGIIGLVLISLSLVTLLFRAFRRYRSSGASEDLWPIMLVLFLVFYNLTESSMMVENAVTWILFIAAAFRLTFEQGTHYQLPLNSPILSQSVRQDNPLGGLAS